ncbi:MAG: protein O-mannosyl-transferase family [bacterium]
MTRRDAGTAVAEALFLAGVAALYAGTMARSIAVGDAGELALAASVVGVPHPPGYPLYTLLGRLAYLFPIQPVALRFNYLSVACALAALFLHLRIGAALGLPLAPRLAATALLAGSYTLWSQSTIAEVYALHLVLVHAVLFVGTLTLRDGRASASHPRMMLLLAYLIGMAAANHPSGALLAVVGVVVWVLARPASWRVSALMPLALLVPATLFAVLIVRSRLDPAIDWGNPETVGACLAHISRARYGDLNDFARPLSVFAGQIAAVARYLGDDLSLPFACAAPAGLVFLFARGPLYTRLPLAFFIVSALGTILLVNFPLTDLALYDNRVFFLPAISLAALGCGAVLHLASARVVALLDARATASAHSARRVASIAIALVILAAAVTPAVRRIPRLDRRDHTAAEDLGRALLIAVDPGATLLASEGQAVHSLAYVSGVLGYRADVKVLDRLGVLGGGRGIGGKALTEGRERSDAIFSSDPQPLRARGLTPVPWGLAFRGGSPETRVSAGIWESLTFRRPERVEAIDFAERDVLVGAYVRMAEHVAWAGLRVRGQDALKEARRIAGVESSRRFATDFAVAYEKVGLSDSALAYWNHAVAASPNDAGVARGAGLAAGRLGDWNAARRFLENAVRGSAGDADVLVELGSACFAFGDSAAARAAWERALSRMPDHREARRGLALLGAAP